MPKYTESNNLELSIEGLKIEEDRTRGVMRLERGSGEQRAIAKGLAELAPGSPSEASALEP